MTKKKLPLVFKVFIGIIVGSIIGQLVVAMPSLNMLLRAMISFSDFFSQYIGFFVPLLILGLVGGGIASLEGNSGSLVGISYITILIATFLITLISTFIGVLISPHIISTVPTVVSGNNTLNFDTLMPKGLAINPLMPGFTAIILAFTVGIACSGSKDNVVTHFIIDLRDIILKVLKGFVIPLLPYYIGCVFANISAKGQLITNAKNFGVVILVLFAVQWAWIFVYHFVAGLMSGKPFLKNIKEMIPAYLTAFATQSSAATIPVTLQCVEKIGISKSIREFVIPFSASTHLMGSVIAQVLGGIAVFYGFYHHLPTDSQIVLYIITFSIILVTTPGVPGGAPAASIPVYIAVFAWSPEVSGVMYALAITTDCIATACNSTCDGGLAIFISGLHNRLKKRSHKKAIKKGLTVEEPVTSVSTS